MSYFEIHGGKKLTGTIEVGGSKNASFPVLAGVVLLSRPIILNNLPDIEDVRCFLQILRELGATIEYLDANGSYEIFFDELKRIPKTSREEINNDSNQLMNRFVLFRIEYWYGYKKHQKHESYTLTADLSENLKTDYIQMNLLDEN